MDAEQMELLERLARLRELGAISRREFAREKESILRAPPRPAPVVLRAVPALAAGAEGSGGALPASAGPFHVAVAPRPRAIAPPSSERSLLSRAGHVAGWVLWTLFSVGGLDALLRHEALEALVLLVCGLLCAPPFHRLLALRMSLPTRLALTAVGALLVLGIGAAPARAAALAPQGSGVPAVARACGAVVAGAVGERSARAREGIARPWRKFWSDLVWARVAGASLYEEWRGARG